MVSFGYDRFLVFDCKPGKYVDLCEFSALPPQVKSDFFSPPHYIKEETFILHTRLARLKAPPGVRNLHYINSVKADFTVIFKRHVFLNVIYFSIVDI